MSHSAEEDLHPSEERFRLLVKSVSDYAIFMLDPQGHVLTWNAGAERIEGYTDDEILGRHVSRFYPPQALEQGLPAHELREAKLRGSFEDEGWRVKKDGSLFWANVAITAMWADNRQFLGYAEVIRDLTQKRKQEEALRQSEERFRLLVEGVSDYAIFMLDANGNIATWNVGAQRIKGYRAEDIIGRHFSIFYPADAKDSGWPEHELQVAAEKGSFVDNGWRLRKDGSTFWANVTITALRDDSGRLVGFAKLTRDLSEPKRVEAMELASQQREETLEAERSARMSAQRATRIKDEFLATLSHELRTPLSAILGWTQVLLRKGDHIAPAEQRRAIEVIDRNARAQVKLIDDLLELSRIMSGKVRLDLQQVCIQDVMELAVESAKPSAQAKGVQLDLLLEPIETKVNADSARLQQIVWNLLTNAIKFTPRGGQIQVALQRIDTRARLSVRDTGIGIPANFLPHVFDRFSQQDSSTTRSFGGLGLGLAIAKQLVELHGGSISVSSPGEGQGTTFFVELPLLSACTQTDAHRRNAQPEVPAAEAPQALPRLDGVHAFIADDEPDARDLLQSLLRDQGALVTALGSARALLDALKAATPDIIISDVGMPEMDGYQMMRALRASEPRDARIPALALTAFARAEDRKRALVAGFQAHLVKPYDVGELILVVANLLGR